MGLRTIAAILAMAVAFPAGTLAEDDGAEAAATLMQVTRLVRVQKTPEGKIITGKKGMKLPQGAVVFTLAKSKCEIKFGDGHMIRLASNARVKIARMSFNRPKRTLVQLLGGRIRAMVDRALGEGDFGVYGSTTITAVKGTDYDVIRKPNGEMQVAVNDGRVWVAEIPSEDLDAVEKVFLGVILGNMGFGITPGNMLHVLPGSPFPRSPIPIPKGFPNPWTGPKKGGAKKSVPGSAPSPPSAPGMPGPGGFGFP